MEQLMEMLQEKYPDIDFENEKNLISDDILDSMDVVNIISEIEDMFDFVN